MIGPPERKSRPGGGGSDLASEVTGGVDRNDPYTRTGEKETAATIESLADEPRYEAGWMRYYDESRASAFVAFLRPYSEDWYDLHPAATWMAAVSKALELTRNIPDCEYVGDGSGA